MSHDTTDPVRLSIAEAEARVMLKWIAILAEPEAPAASLVELRPHLSLVPNCGRNCVGGGEGA